MSGASGTGVLATLRGAPRSVRALLIGVFVNKLGAFLQVFLVLFLTQRGFSSVQAGIALGVYGAGSVVGVLVGGSLSDRLGPRRATLLSMSGTAGLTLAVLYLHRYGAVLGAVGLLAAIGQVYRPASAALLSEETPPHRQVMIFALYRLALNLGTTAAPLIGAALLAVSYRLLFWGEALAALGFAAIAAVALPAPRRVRQSSGEVSDVARCDKAPGYRAVVADRAFSLFLLAVLINSVVYIQYLTTLPLAMRERGLSTSWYGAMVAINGLIVITLELAVTRVVQTWAARRVVAIGFTLLGGGLAFYALPGGTGVFVVGTVVWSLAEIVGGPTIFAYPPQAAPDALRGRYIGAAQAMFGLGSAVGPVMGVAVWSAFGRSVWVGCGLFSLVGMVAAWRGMRPAGTPARPAEETVADLEGMVEPPVLALSEIGER